MGEQATATPELAAPSSSPNIKLQRKKENGLLRRYFCAPVVAFRIMCTGAISVGFT